MSPQPRSAVAHLAPASDAGHARHIARIVAHVAITLMVALAGCRNATGAEDRAAVRGDVVELTLEVAPERVACVGMVATTCLQVRARPDAPWSLFHGEIAGFVHEPGFHFTLRVSRTVVPNPPADGSRYRWQLLRLVSRTPA